MKHTSNYVTVQLETIIILTLSNNHTDTDNLHALMCAIFCPLTIHTIYQQTTQCTWF
jgi:hypothetical protein